MSKFLNLDYKNATSNLINESLLEKLKKFKEVIVFGAGASGEWVVSLLRHYHIEPVCFCDNSPRKWGSVNPQTGLEVMSFETAIQRHHGAAICVASMWVEEIYNQIGEYNKNILDRTWNMLTTMAWETSSKLYESTEAEFIQQNGQQFEKLYHMLTDDKSKETLYGILNYRLTRDEKYLHQIKSNEMVYLDRELFGDKQIEKIFSASMIDGGSFDGDTVEEFLRVSQKDDLDIHCYEAEECNCILLKEKLKKWEPNRITVHEAALWSKSCNIYFDGNGLSGKSSEKQTQNSNLVQAEAIDDYGYGEVSFIKLDIEGAEREALIGAVNVIKKYRPILAICAYHLQDDLLVLSDLIDSIGCGYQLYLRHYMLSAGDTVLYAVPK